MTHNDGFDLVCQGACCDKPLFGDNDRLDFHFGYEGNKNELGSLLIKNNALGYIWVKAFKKISLKDITSGSIMK